MKKIDDDYAIDFPKRQYLFIDNDGRMSLFKDSTEFVWTIDEFFEEASIPEELLPYSKGLCVDLQKFFDEVRNENRSPMYKADMALFLVRILPKFFVEFLNDKTKQISDMIKQLKTP